MIYRCGSGATPSGDVSQGDSAMHLRLTGIVREFVWPAAMVQSSCFDGGSIELMSYSRDFRMHRKHFLFVSCPFGGTEVFMKNLKLYVDTREDIDSHWVEIPRLAPSASDGIGAIANNWTVRASRATFSAIRALRKRGVEINAAFFNHLTAVSLLLWYRQRIPCVLSLDTTPSLLEHDAEWYGRGGLRTRGIARQLSHYWTSRTYAAMRCLIPWSEFARNSLVADYGIPADRSFVLPPGIDLSLWKPDFQRKKRDQMSVLFVGGDFVRKGGDVVLRVAAREEFRDVDFHFVTTSYAGGTFPNVHVHTDIKPNSDGLMNLYRKSDVFVLPTKADYAPTNAVVEALAMGLPTLTTNVGGMGEIVHDGVNGYVLRPPEDEDLGKRLLFLKASRDILDKMKLGARASAENMFDIRQTGSKIIEMLHGL
jgi:glycosyltransferase involved in cell wall biosynthesis